MRENLRQVAAAHGAKTMNPDAELVERLREALGQLGRAQVGHAVVQVSQELMHVLVGLKSPGLDLGRGGLDVFDQNRLAFGADRREQTIFGVFEHQAMRRQAIQRTGCGQKNLWMWFALGHFVTAHRDIEILQDIGVDQVFLGNRTPTGGGYSHGQAVFTQAFQHFEQAILDRYAMVTHIGQFQLIRALAHLGIGEVFAMIGLGQRFGLFRAQA